MSSGTYGMHDDLLVPYSGGINPSVVPVRNVVDQAQVDLAFYEDQIGKLEKNLSQINIQRDEVARLLGTAVRMAKSIRQVLGEDQAQAEASR
jgi:hypothetical protein